MAVINIVVLACSSSIYFFLLEFFVYFNFKQFAFMLKYVQFRLN